MRNFSIWRKDVPFLFCLLCGLFPAPSGMDAAEIPGKLRVLLFSGRNNHDWQQTTPVLKAIYEDSGRFAVDVVENPAACVPETLKGYDVLVSNWSAWPELTERAWGPALEQAIMDFVRGGKGLVVFHAAAATFHTWPEFQQLVGYTWDTNRTGHGQIHTFKVKVQNPNHPVTRGLPDFYTTDELWHRPGQPPADRVLCTAYSDPDKGGSGTNEPVVLGSELGQGRCFSLILGHDAAALRQIGWRTLMLRGTEWAATSQVTWPVPSDLPLRADAVSLANLDSGSARLVLDAQRALVQAGGYLPVWYHYQQVPFKPYVERLYSPSGLNVVRDAPFDHLHHHGLMYAMNVDGADFWIEAGQPGRQAHTGFSDIRVGQFKGMPTAGFTEQLDWLSPTNSACLLKEQRTLTWVRLAGQKLTWLNWESRFGLPDGKAAAILTGAHYHGLGLRFIQPMDAVGEFYNASGQPGTVFRGEERLVDANWCAYTAPVEGKPMTVVMLAHPDNPRHPATWFTMTRAFAFLSATMRLHEKPLSVKAGQPITLRYAVLVAEERLDPAQIQRHYEWWVK